MIKNPHNFQNSVSIGEKTVTLFHDVLNDELTNIVKPIFNPENSMMLNLNQVHRKFSKLFSEKTQDLPNKRAPNTYVSQQKSCN